MRKLCAIMAAVLITSSSFAQAPFKMSYQGVVRNADNALLINQEISMRLSILQGSVFGNSVYIETHTPTTNINGLVSLEIGTGAVIRGAFNNIDWSNGPFFIKTEADPTGGSFYTVTETSQLMSVPFSLHSNTADSVIGGLIGPRGPKGDSGLIGLQGPIGIQGTPGMQGIPGLKGDTGIQGIQGIQGITGTAGPAGVSGAAGPAGVAGPNGATGALLRHHLRTIL
ncbi:collagen-like protein [Vicingaceae bacterium]|nr:collagen-like protein [Vicingaceae bacterium]